MRLLGLVYFSEMVNDMSLADIQEIISKAQEKNRNHNITGFLMFNASGFLQYLEGPVPLVQTLFNTISNDKRHEIISLSKNYTLEKRLFSDFPMGFYSEPRTFFEKTPGFIPIETIKEGLDSVGSGFQGRPSQHINYLIDVFHKADLEVADWMLDRIDVRDYYRSGLLPGINVA